MLSIVRLALGFGGSFNGIILAVSAGIAAFLLYTSHIEHKAAKKAATEIVQKATDDAKNAEIASEKVRVASGKSGAIDRLRSDPKSCPDCIKGGNGKPVQKLAASDNQKR